LRAQPQGGTGRERGARDEPEPRAVAELGGGGELAAGED
jgi:hypothetical protein